MTKLKAHNVLMSRVRFTGTLELVTPLRLSSGRASDLTDAPFMRDANEKPYIPGTSLRGAVRAAIEQVVAAVGAGAGLRACTLFSEDDCAVKAKETIAKDMAEKEILALVEKDFCDVCKLFGSTVYASRIVFEDACPVDGNAVKSNVRDCVGIDRDTGAARSGVKFDYEVLEKGLSFTFEMEVENLCGNDQKIINILLGLLSSGIYLGGKRAAGLGKVKLRSDYEVTGFNDMSAVMQSLMAGHGLPNGKVDWKREVK